MSMQEEASMSGEEEAEQGNRSVRRRVRVERSNRKARLIRTIRLYMVDHPSHELGGTDPIAEKLRNMTEAQLEREIELIEVLQSKSVRRGFAVDFATGWSNLLSYLSGEEMTLGEDADFVNLVSSCIGTYIGWIPEGAQLGLIIASKTIQAVVKGNNTPAIVDGAGFNPMSQEQSGPGAVNPFE